MGATRKNDGEGKGQRPKSKYDVDDNCYDSKAASHLERELYVQDKRKKGSVVVSSRLPSATSRSQGQCIRAYRHLLNPLEAAALVFP